MARIESLLRVSGLHKSYNAPVLVDFDFDLRAGEVHALVGSNGAGKSTFARILSGMTPRDGGDIRFDGQPFAPRSKREAEDSGILMVQQELNIVPTMTVAENIFLSRLPRRSGFVRYGALQADARQALLRVGLGDLDPEMPAGRLGVGQQQLVEIAGALARDCRLLILDEPTAALTDPEIETLFENVLRLQAADVGIIYVSHRMDEIRRITNRTTVMRDGRRIATHETVAATTATLVREMAGHDLPDRKSGAARTAGEIALQVRNLADGERVQDVSFQVRRGEIVGIAGLIGSGRTETLRTIFGAGRRLGGEVSIAGRVAKIRHPADAVRAGIGLVPEDRKQDGLLLSQSIRINATLATVAHHANRAGWLDTAKETRAAVSVCDRLGVRCASTEQPVGELSGGNQQKVVIARWLARDCDILLFDEPTRGIDVAAKDTIYQLLRDLVAEGKAVLVVSSELVELMALCDRILVMSGGRIAAEFTPEEWTQEKITRAAFSAYLGEKGISRS